MLQINIRTSRIQISCIYFIYFLTIILACHTVHAADSVVTADKIVKIHNHTLSINTIQGKVAAINRSIGIYRYCVMELGADNHDIPIKEKGEAAAFFKKYGNYVKLIVTFFQNKQDHVTRELTEYYFICDINYIVKLRAKDMCSLFEFVSGFKNNFRKYEKMKKEVVSRFIFLNDQLVMWIDSENKVHTTPDEGLITEGNLLLRQKNLIIDNIVMD